MMKALGQRYVQYVNRTYRRSGTLWEGRYRSSLLQDEVYLLICYRYIELNPVRVVLVDGVRAYFHRPHPDKAALKYRVKDVRDFLTRIGEAP